MQLTVKVALAHFLLDKYGHIQPGPHVGTILVVDGGMLLHSVTYQWKKGSTFGAIAGAYVSHVKGLKNTNQHLDVTVVFDVYDQHTTKDHTHALHVPIKCLEIEVREEAILDTSKVVFLSNPKNKQKFVNFLAGQLRQCDVCECILCEGDADTEIVNATII